MKTRNRVNWDLVLVNRIWIKMVCLFVDANLQLVWLRSVDWSEVQLCWRSATSVTFVHRQRMCPAFVSFIVLLFLAGQNGARANWWWVFKEKKFFLFILKTQNNGILSYFKWDKKKNLMFTFTSDIRKSCAIMLRTWNYYQSINIFTKLC